MDMKIRAMWLIPLVITTTTVAQGDPQPGDGKSETVAKGLSIGGSLVGPLLIFTAAKYGSSFDDPLHGEFDAMIGVGAALTILGPSLGEWYSHKWLTRGLAWRLAGGAGLLLSGAIVSDSLFGNDGAVIPGVLFGASGLVAVLAGISYDILDAAPAARDYNRRNLHIGLAPAVGGRGLAVVGNF